jgi:hypothetical protein
MRPARLAAVLLAAAAGAAGAQALEKNGLPCVAEVCLGDGLEALAGIAWEPALSPRGSAARPLKVRDRTLETPDRAFLQRVFRGVPPAAALWLADRRFDREGLPTLAGVQAACAENWLEGRFLSGGGNPTTVTIQRVPDGPGGQRWAVTRITRHIAGAATSEQRSAAEATLKERYAAFDITRRPRIEASQRAMFQLVTATQWGFKLSLPTDPRQAEQLRSHAACGGGGGQPATLD